MDASVPFNAVNSAYYQLMIDAIANMGARYKGPNYGRVRGYLLSKLVEDVKKMIEDYRTVFLKSVDASHVSKTADTLFKLLRDVVLFVGPENIVHVVMDNAAGRLLESEFSRLYWSPCAALCANLMLQDIGKLQEFTGGREILRPAPTRFATNFITFQSILAQKDALRAMVTSREWTSSAYSKEAKAKKFVDQFTKSFVRVLRIVDGEDRAAMEFDKRKKITSGLLDVIERYAYGDANLNTKLTNETRIFKNAEGDFGRQSAIRKRSTVMLDQWWESYGCGAPNLQKLAIRVLSQTCSSSGCERYNKEVDALRNNLANMSLQSALDNLDQLNLEDDGDDDEANNNSVKNTNQNETNH
ncbi:uncharacterized protein [Arachis hypogaea]|uniref:uncharacterized protein n=1 Tax=Arachis hypogaea TaxID=3818 RepID=UPI0010FC5E18|nr:uncharacterized protein LOC112805891 [Arachis hypogaea]